MKIAIIGSGFAGLCMGVKLKEAGIDDFTIYEKAGELGGTWRDNTYPGCACDVQSHLYSFSFDLNPNWSRTFSGQQEIWEYMDNCAEKFQIKDHIQFNTGITEAIFNEKANCWTIKTDNGETVEAQILVTGTGGLSLPAFPDINGMERFGGEAFHSAEWNNNFDIKGKRIAVIGTGASAIQIVPSIAPEVERLYLFQRTPPWILPKPDRAFSRFEIGLFNRLPVFIRLYRSMLYWGHEFFATGFVVSPKFMKLPQWLAKQHIRKTIDDPQLQKKLIPNYTIGCKRVLLSNDYYPALNRENVDVITNGIDHIEETGIVTKDGKRHEVDALVYATGFKATEYLSNVHVLGKNGQVLRELWEENGGEAYKGTTVAGFPNMFMFTGPNTGLGHSSVIIMMEAQVRYIMDCLQKMERQNIQCVDVKQEAQDAYNNWVQEQIAKSVWQAGGCKSWYQDETGKNVTLWPGYTFTFAWKTRRFDEENYEKVKAVEEPVEPVATQVLT